MTERTRRFVRGRFDTPPGTRYDGRAMNRGKFWLFMALTLVAGIANLLVVSRAVTQRALGDLDREQRAAATQIDARAQLLAADAERLADAVARDPATVQALSPDAPGVVDATAASRAATDAARTMGLGASRPLLVVTSGRGGRSASVGDEAAQLQHDEALFPEEGTARREGYARTERGIWYVVAVPAGKGAAVGVGLPIDAKWLASLKSATGSDVTLAVEGRKPLGTLSARDAAVVEAAARARPSASQGVGKLGREGPPIGPMRLLFPSAPAFRVHVLALKGTSGALALSRATAPILAPLATYQWTMLGALVALALVGLALGLLITNEQAALVPKALTNAADRISRGDFAARAPIMAGSLGTIAAALNRAVEAAEAAARPPSAWEGPTSQLGVPESLVEGPTEQISPEEMSPEKSESTPIAGHEWVPRREVPAGQETLAAQEGEGSGAAEAPTSEPSPAPAELAAGIDGAPAPAEDGLALAAAEGRGPMPFEPTIPLRRDDESAVAEAGAREAKTDDLLAPPPAPEAMQEAPAAPMPWAEEAAAAAAASLEAAAAAMSASPEEAAAPAPPPEPATPAPAVPAAAAPGSPVSTADEDHWSSIYQEFIKVRRDCGESAEGVPYQRFRSKLQQNRDHMVAKYGCRTVRFQVYVKQGKAALKASPVR
jgi:hypothetical protein